MATQVRSSAAAALLADLLAVGDLDLRRQFYRDLGPRDTAALFAAARREHGTPYSLFADDPVGFVELVLGETLWTRQKEILSALRDAQRVAVPSCFESGKTFLCARAVAWHCCVYPPGAATAVTTATRFRQVQRQVWPHIRHLVATRNLPGECDTTQWRMRAQSGQEVVAAYGFTAPPHEEAAVQGIHSPRLLLVVEEAGGIDRTVGRGVRGLVSNPFAKMLAIGNPPTDEEHSWFEDECADPDVTVLPIPTSVTPNFTGEPTGPCRSCPPGLPSHHIAEHLVNPAWQESLVRERGEDDPFVAAKVHARFPSGGPRKAIPSGWIDAAADLTEDERVPESGGIVTLGVDPAGAGGDELAIARSVGGLVQMRHASAGAVNRSAVDVAGVILAEIRAAEVLAREVGSDRQVRVRVDAIGMGWGVASILALWGEEGMHGALVVKVIASEAPSADDPEALERPANRRAEMWLAFRRELQPDANGSQRVRLDVDHRTQAQLAAPYKKTNSQGKTLIESKDDMRKRGVASGDRADAVLLSRYTGADPRRKRRGLLVV